MPDLDPITQVLRVDDARYTQGMNRAARATDRMERQVEQLNRDVNRSNVSFNTWIFRLNRTRVVIGLLLSGFGITTLVRRVSELGATATESGLSVGLAAQELQSLQFVLEGNGIAAEQSLRAFQNFNNAVGEARTGAAEYARVFERLQIDLTRFGDSAEDTRRLLDEVFAALRTGGIAEATEAARAIFGRTGADLLATVRGPGGSPEDIRQAQEDAIRLALIPSDDQLAALKELDQSFLELGTTLQNFGAQVVADFVPQLIAINRSIRDALVPSLSTFRVIVQNARSLLERFTDVARAAVVVLGIVALRAATAFGTGAVATFRVFTAAAGRALSAVVLLTRSVGLLFSTALITRGLAFAGALAATRIILRGTVTAVGAAVLSFGRFFGAVTLVSGILSILFPRIQLFRAVFTLATESIRAFESGLILLIRLIPGASTAFEILEGTAILATRALEGISRSINAAAFDIEEFERSLPGSSIEQLNAQLEDINEQIELLRDSTVALGATQNQYSRGAGATEFLEYFANLGREAQAANLELQRLAVRAERNRLIEERIAENGRRIRRQEALEAREATREAQRQANIRINLGNAIRALPSPFELITETGTTTLNEPSIRDLNERNNALEDQLRLERELAIERTRTVPNLAQQGINRLLAIRDEQIAEAIRLARSPTLTQVEIEGIEAREAAYAEYTRTVQTFEDRIAEAIRNRDSVSADALRNQLELYRDFVSEARVFASIQERAENLAAIRLRQEREQADIQARAAFERDQNARRSRDILAQSLRASRNIERLSRQSAFQLVRGLERAIVSAERLGDVIRNIGIEFLQLFLREAVLNPFAILLQASISAGLSSALGPRVGAGAGNTGVTDINDPNVGLPRGFDRVETVNNNTFNIRSDNPEVVARRVALALDAQTSTQQQNALRPSRERDSIRAARS